MELVQKRGCCPRFQGFGEHKKNYMERGQIEWRELEEIREAARKWALELGWGPEGEDRIWTTDKCVGKILGEISPETAEEMLGWKHGSLYVAAICGAPVFCTDLGGIVR
ncbi:MAG: hypothetical protein G8D86_04580 [gamma proteobacterium symbiont of Ctena orbiculata]